jgi:hypothetical protein
MLVINGGRNYKKSTAYIETPAFCGFVLPNEITHVLGARAMMLLSDGAASAVLGGIADTLEGSRAPRPSTAAVVAVLRIRYAEGRHAVGT